MDRRSFIKKAGVAGTAAAASTVLAARAVAQEAETGAAAPAVEAESAAPAAPAAPAVVAETPKFTWRLSSGFPKQLDTLFGAAEVFADSVRQATDGNFDIQVSAPGEIVDAAGGLEAVQNGTVDMIHTASNYFWERDPSFAFGTGVPFGLNQRMTNAWLYEGGGMDLLNAFYAKFNIVGFPAGNTGAQMGGWFRKEINSLEDMQDLKLRIGGFGGRIVEKIGVVPQDLPAGKIYQALENGTIDAAEFVGPYDDEKLGLNRVAKYYYYPGWWEGGVAATNMINLDKWNALPKTYQEAVRTGSALTNSILTARYDTLNPPALKALVERGTILRPYSHDILVACFNAAEESYAEIAAENTDFKTLLESYMGYRRDAYLWFQISEYAQDTFLMLQQRAGRL
jgi:TRAP-type mannitol/chloroaromatic compound transport system substrate-binding protein